MIKSIEIKNFQSHSNSFLEFHPGVNIIVGSTDSGKTAILRALRFVVWNRPSGNDFRSHWAEQTSVKIDVGDVITRLKKDKKNLYYLNDREYTAFGADVPEEIQNSLNIGDINLQKQLDQPFLLTASPGEVAHHFNKVANLDLIGEAERKISSWLRKERGNLNSCKDQLKRHREDLAQYKDLHKMEVALEVLEDLQETIETEWKRKQKLESLISDIQQVEKNIDEKSQLLEIEPLVLSTIQKMEEKEKILKTHEQLTDIIITIERIDEKLEKVKSFLAMEKTVTRLILLLQSKREKEQKFNLFTATLQDFQNTETLRKEKQQEVERKEKEFEEIFPEECPLCGKPY